MARWILSTIKGKIIVCVTLVMVVSTVVNLYFTKRDVGSAIMVAQEKSAKNILHSFYLVIREDYHTLLSSKRTMTLEKRNHLKKTAQMIHSVFAGFYKSVPIGSDPSAAIRSALDWMDGAPFEKTHFYILDKNFHLLSTSNKNITRNALEVIKDLKGRQISNAMCFDRLRSSGDYAIFNMPGENGEENRLVLSFFLPFSSWEFTIAVSVDISDIEAEAEAAKKRYIKSLKDYASQVTVTESGFVCMVDADDQVLIAPPDHVSVTMEGISRRIKEEIDPDKLPTSDTTQVSEIRYMTRENDGSRPMIIYCTYFKPLKWYTGVVIPLNEINEPARNLVIRQSLIIAFMFMAGLIAVFILVSRISKPLHLLSLHARKLPQLDLSKPLPDFPAIDALTRKHKDEVGTLASSFVIMRRELNKNIQDLLQVIAARHRIESELNIAREIQLGMVPKTFPFLPEIPEFDLYATLQPAKEVGGDLYDFFLIDEDHLCFTLGDVSEKGVPSALFMVVTRTLIRTLSEKMASPSQVMEKINDILSSDNPRSMFVTLVIGLLNIRTGEIKYANGGHNPPVVIPHDSDCYYQKGKNQPLVGAMEGIPYSDITLTLSAKDSFFLYTDGVNEAMNADSEQFSSERLLACLQKNKTKNSDQVIDAMLKDVRDHAKDAPQSDDIAMLMIKYHGK